MTNKNSQNQSFDHNELLITNVPREWSKEELLSKECLFFLEDLQELLNINPHEVKKKLKEIRDSGESSWKVMGVKKVWAHWVVRMKVFAPFYQEHFSFLIRTVPKDWDINRLLHEKGLFPLARVEKLLPLKPNQLRYQAKKNPNSRAGMGIWKHEKENIFVVDMEIFKTWLTNFWLNTN